MTTTTSTKPRLRREQPSAPAATVRIDRDLDGAWSLRAEMWLARPLEEVFPFFADPENLERITPPLLRFRILSPRPIEMRVGQLIDYRLRVRGVPIRWRTEITAYDPPRRFIDMQIRGPYRLWEHEHTFEEQDGGTVVRDRVRYRPLGGVIAHRLLVARDLRRIFAFRQREIERLLAPRPD